MKDNPDPKPSNVYSPPHYTAGGIEVIDFIAAKRFGYNLGNVIKYISRADLKGKRLEDLQKAKWYLDREILTELARRNQVEQEASQ